MVLRQEPLGKQLEFPAQQRRVVVRQHAGPAGQLDPDQRADRIGIKRGGVAGIQHLQVGRGAEVRKQQEAAIEVAGQHFRDMHSRRLEKLLHMQPGAAILVRRRRIHDDARRAVVEGGAKIAAETGIGRGRRKGEAASRPQSGKPRFDLLLAFHVEVANDAREGAKAPPEGALRGHEVLEFAILASADKTFPGKDTPLGACRVPSPLHQLTDTACLNRIADNSAPAHCLPCWRWLQVPPWRNRCRPCGSTRRCWVPARRLHRPPLPNPRPLPSRSDQPRASLTCSRQRASI